MRVYGEYLIKAIRLAGRGTIQNALNWGPIIGAGALGGYTTSRGATLIFPEGWVGVVVSAIVYALAAWLIFFLFRLIFVAPYQLWKENRRPEYKPKLQEFYVAVGPLIGRRLDRAISADDFERYVEETSAWATNAAAWIEQNLGAAARARFLDTTGMMAADVMGTVNRRHNAIVLNLTRLRRNLAAMIEDDSWV